MSAAQNKEIIRRHFALYDRNRLDEDFAMYWAPDVKVHGFGPSPLDHQGFKQVLQMFANAFADSHHSLDLMIADGDMAATYWT